MLNKPDTSEIRFAAWGMDQDVIAWKFGVLKTDMDERLQRLWVAAEAQALGWGGASLVAKATGVSLRMEEAATGIDPGCGRPPMIVVDANVLAYLYLPGEYTAAAEALLLRDAEWAAPVLWRSELRNLLAGCMRRKALTFDQACSLQSEAE